MLLIDRPGRTRLTAQMLKLRFSDFVIPLLAAAVLLPPIRFETGLPDIRLQAIIIVAAWLLFFLPFLSSGGQAALILRWNPANKWFFLFALCIIISMGLSAFAHNLYPIARDFWELGKLLLYFLLFFFMANLKILPEDLKRYYTASLIIFMLSALFGFAQFFNFLDINTLISPLYATTQLETLILGRRIVGTGANPNDFAYMMVLSASLALTGALWLKGRNVRIFSWIVFFLSCLAVVLTRSRSGLLALIAACLIIAVILYIVCFGLNRTARMLLATSPLLLLLLIAIINLAPDAFYTYISSAFNLETDASWQVRQNAWPAQLELWQQSPVFGWGPAKETMTSITDSEWILLLRRYGIFGVLIFTLLFISIFITLAKISQRYQRSYLNVFCYGLQAVLIVYAIIMLPAGFYHNIQLASILFIYFGLVFSQRRFFVRRREA